MVVTRTRVVILAFFTLAFTLLAGLGHAQTLDISAEPNYGSASLTPGFTPDPYRIDVVSGGTVNASTVDPACNGYVTASPDVRLFWSGGGALLRFSFAGDGDTTLVINGPDGNWYCNDDFDGPNPLVEFAPPLDGGYDIWVGSFAADTNVTGQLSISELGMTTTVPPSAAGGLDPSRPANFGSVMLGSGFTPDPYTTTVLSGGSIDVAALSLGPDCRGFATAAPDFSLTLTGESPLLRVFVVADGDVTLVVNRPDGSWACNDDYSDLDPLLEFASPLQGRYDIWIGSFQSGTVVPGTIYITELGLDPGDF